jgi:NADPH:quinone reductase-like Zn-dependent oxidoreductase
VSRPGGYDRLQLVEEPDPEAGPGQVVVDVRAAGVNYADCIVRMGLYESAKKYVGWPITPGFEVAGTVASTGQGASRFRLGDRVFGVSRFGGYASQVAVPENQLFSIPEGWSLVQAAAFPTVFLTAWYALRELCKLRRGDKILVHSASGGVGSAALQIARAFSCDPVGIVGGAHKVETARMNGAVAVLDKYSGDLWQKVHEAAPDGYHVALDPNGEATLMRSYKALRPTGRLILYGFSSMIPRQRGKPNYLRLAYKYFRTPRFNPILMTGSNKAVMAFNLSYLFDENERLKEAMHELLDLVGQGLLHPLETRCFPLAQANAAHRELETGKTTGKLVLTIPPD